MPIKRIKNKAGYTFIQFMNYFRFDREISYATNDPDLYNFIQKNALRYWKEGYEPSFMTDFYFHGDD